jgi:hypothetical protein
MGARIGEEKKASYVFSLHRVVDDLHCMLAILLYYGLSCVMDEFLVLLSISSMMDDFNVLCVIVDFMFVMFV